MNWAPPSIDPEPGAAAPAIADADHDHRSAGAVPAAMWLAVLGGVLVVAAAIAIVASNWTAIGEGLRVAGLGVATVGLIAAAERLRAPVPATAGIIAHVGTLLTASIGIAVLSMLGATWPTCITAGGVVLVAVAGLQADRWRSGTMHLAQIAGFAMTATGIAAVTGTTAGVVAMIFAVALLVTGAHRRSVGLAVLAVFSPALTALADAGIGSGSLERAGLVGERLSWSGPLVGILAATVIGSTAMRSRNDSLILVAVASPIVGAVTGLASIDGSAVAWWSLPALALIAAELGLHLLSTEHFRAEVGEVVTVGAGTMAVGLWLAPLAASFGTLDSGVASPWAIPVVTTVLAVAASTLRWHRADSPLADVGLAALAAGTTALVIALGGGAFLVAIVAIAATAGAVMSSRRIAATATYGSAGWALLASITARDDLSGTGATVIPLVLIAATVAVVLVARCRLAAERAWVGWIEMTLTASVATLAVLAVTANHAAAIALATVAVFVVAAASIEQRFTTWGLAMIGATGLLSLENATSTGLLDESYTFGWWIVTAALIVLASVRPSRWLPHAIAAAATISVATAAPLLHVGAVDFTVMAMLVVVALTGLGYTWGRRTPLDTAALTAGFVLLCTTSFDIAPAWASVAWVVIGFQIVVAGYVLGRPPVRVAGCLVSMAGAMSWWFTSGLHDRFLTFVEPADITATDVWTSILWAAALVAGLTTRATLSVNSWVAYSAPVVISGVWLVTVHVDRGTVWALPLLLTIGVTAVIAGGWHRLAAPLVGGTLLTITGVFLASGTDLTAIPTWGWLASGGAALLGAAVAIERRGRPGASDLRTLMSRWG